eukprot:CAMPEP_0172508234 /NCGR_PEP_ID=MMETSP1066-20121228/210451_1 /TAXON_ID=671091 /ORGANISM="Coscinodiscus wailesii, Strain CCMP2513" /LENGTH=162 /DNA_ID=CAMNT_0013286139 /DNA_START=44 /DNA_END=529 /DNA_ORIENTATION=+
MIVPGECLKQRLQMGRVASWREGVASMVRDGAYFRGYGGVCLRDVPYTMLELGIYDNLKSWYGSTGRHRLRSRSSEENRRGGGGGAANEGTTATTTQLFLSRTDEIVIAAVTGGITGFLTNPFDAVKTKLMVDDNLHSTRAVLYTGVWDCFRKTVRDHGWGS